MDESEYTNKLIKWYESKEWDSDPAINDYELIVDPEAHYNNYGERGYLDLFIRVDKDDMGNQLLDDYLISIKSQSAIKNSTGANEIIGQWSKVLSNFYPGSDYEYPSWCHYYLAFTPEKECLDHVKENDSMYGSAKSIPDKINEETDHARASVGTIVPTNEEVPLFLPFEVSEYGDWYVEDYIKNLMERKGTPDKFRDSILGN